MCFLTVFRFHERLDMTPTTPMDNITNRLFRYTESLGNISLLRLIFGAFRAYIYNLFFCKFGKTMSLSTYGTTFRNHIRRIVSLGSEKHMIWTNATRIIANMAKNSPVWKLSVDQLPSDSMSQTFAFKTMTTSNLSISHIFSSTSPKPTGIGFVDFIPEPNSDTFY